MKSINQQSRYPYYYLVPAILIYFCFNILPSVLGLVLGFTDWNAYHIFEFNYVGLENFKMIAEESYTKIALKNSLYFTLVVAIFSNLFGLLIALVATSGVKIKNYIRTIVFMPIVLSPIIIGVIFKALYEPQNGLLNVFLGSIGLDFLQQEWIVDPKLAMTSVCAMEVWNKTGFRMVIYISGLMTIPKSFLEAAAIDGATGFKRFTHITIPLIMPAVTVNVLLSIVNGFKAFGQVYALTEGGPANATQVVLTYIYKAFSQGRYGYASAIGLCFTIIVSIISFAILGPMRKREVEY